MSSYGGEPQWLRPRTWIEQYITDIANPERQRKQWMAEAQLQADKAKERRAAIVMNQRVRSEDSAWSLRRSQVNNDSYIEALYKQSKEAPKEDAPADDE